MRPGPEANLGGLDHLIRPNAARAYPKPANSAIDQGTDLLQVGFEPAGTDVVGVADDPANNRGLAADFTVLGHDDSHKRGLPASRKRPSIAEPGGPPGPCRYPDQKEPILIFPRLTLHPGTKTGKGQLPSGRRPGP